MKKQLLIAVAVLGTVVACKKEETKTPETSTPTQETPVQKAQKVLMSQDWKLQGTFIGIVGGPLLPLPMEDCEKDNFIRYTADFKQQIYFGTEKCDSFETDMEVIGYGLSQKADSFYVITPEEKMSFAITNLTASKFEITGISGDYQQRMVLVKR